MLPIKSSVFMTIIDFLLYMESGPLLPALCRTPIINKFVFDTLVRGLNDDATSIHYDEAGPLQVTNVFIKEYLFDSDPDESSAILEQLSKVNSHFSQVPLYQLQSVCGFLNRHNFVSVTSPVSTSFTDVVALNHCESQLKAIYKVYLGTVTLSSTLRIEYYNSNYLLKDAKFIDTYASNGAWNVD